MAIPVDEIGSEIVQSDSACWRNPRNDSTANKVMNGFSLSPQRQVLVLSATASLQ